MWSFYVEPWNGNQRVWCSEENPGLSTAGSKIKMGVPEMNGFKKLTMLFVLIGIVAGGLYAEGLNGDAITIKTLDAGGYEVLLKRAKIEWPGDSAMQLYHLNREAEAYIALASDRQIDKEIYFRSLSEWSNVSLDESFAQIDLAKMENKKLIFLYGDFQWTMVKWEYDRQCKAKGAF